MDEKVRQAIRDYDVAHPPKDPVDRRRRALAEAHEAEERAKQAQQARETQQLAQQQQVSGSWVQWTDQRIHEHLKRQWGPGSGRNPLIEAMGEVIGRERQDRRQEVEAAVEEARHAFETKFTTLEDRVRSVLAVLDERVNSANAIGQRAAQESADRHQESRQAVEKAQRHIETTERAFEARSGPGGARQSGGSQGGPAWHRRRAARGRRET